VQAPAPREEKEELTAHLRERLGAEAVGIIGHVLILYRRQFTDLEQRLLASFKILNSGTRDHLEAARLKNRCQSLGLNVSGPDCLIAVLAIAGGHRLYAIDGDLDQLAEHSPLELFRESEVS
jgi:predicted nucleic acid-binding protein